MLIRVIAIVLTCSAAASGQDAAAAFDALKGLSGAWRARVGAKGAVVQVEFRTLSNGSALIESYRSPSGKETLTVFHMNGSRLMATHYCAQGNQPRLVLEEKERSGELVFRYLDATNLKSEGDSHLVRLNFRIRDRDHFEIREVYVERGAEEATEYGFTRVADLR